MICSAPGERQLIKKTSGLEEDEVFLTQSSEASIGLFQVTIVDERMIPVSPRCVIVDDDREFLERVSRWFRISGLDFEVVTFTGGVEAVDYLHRERADLILTAYLLAAMDGLQLISIVRRFDARVPICMMSRVPMKATALARGATAFFSKSELWPQIEAFIAKLSLPDAVSVA